MDSFIRRHASGLSCPIIGAAVLPPLLFRSAAGSSSLPLPCFRCTLLPTGLSPRP